MEGTGVTPGVTGVRWARDSHAVNQEPDAECNREGDLAQILWRASKMRSNHQTQQIWEQFSWGWHLCRECLHLKISPLLRLLSSPLAKKLFRCHRSSRRGPSKWSPRWWIRGINFTRWSFRWHDRGTRPLLSPFLFGKKNDTPKKTRSSVGRMRLSQSALDGLQACLVLQASFLRTENQDIVTLSSTKCWYFLVYIPQPALWEDVLDGCILLRSQFQYQMSNWKSKTNVWSNAVGTIWGGVGSTNHLCLKHFSCFNYIICNIF